MGGSKTPSRCSRAQTGRRPRDKGRWGALDWSYELLGIDEEEVLDILGRLVDKSLVVAEAGQEGALRYRMLEPVRQYGQERLEAVARMAAASEEVEATRRRHA